MQKEEYVHRRGNCLFFTQPPVVAASAAVGGKKEGEGPLGGCFDLTDPDTTFGQPSWERAEQQMQILAAGRCLQKASLSPERLDVVFAGDLQAQCTATNYCLRQLNTPMAGVYGACSTMAETLALAGCFCATGLAGHALAMTSSHFCAAERQFRFPLEYGGKRTPTSQWTATAAGCALVEPRGFGPQIESVCFGRVVDKGVCDANNMGAAMAPAAADTLLRFFCDTQTGPADYDRSFTGDLGLVGSCLLAVLCQKQGVELSNHEDCGLLLYDRQTQQVGAGGSGAGCSASVLCGDILPKLRTGALKKVLFIATGALMSTALCQQKESIPGIAHLVCLTAAQKGGKNL